MSDWGKAAKFESDAAQAGVSDDDIHASRLSGMDPADIEQLRVVTINERLLLVIRCPKCAARFHHGKAQAKPLAVTGKTGADGLLHRPDGRTFVSDYDLMCVCRVVGPADYEPIFFSGVDPTNKRSALTPEATALIRKLSAGLKSKFQHGAQDDFNSDKHPNAKDPLTGRFVAIDVGTLHFFPTAIAVRDFYLKRGLRWRYDDTFRFVPS